MERTFIVLDHNDTHTHTHTHTHTNTHDRTPLDVGSTRRNTEHSQKTVLQPAVSEHAIPQCERPQNHALHHATNESGKKKSYNAGTTVSYDVSGCRLTLALQVNWSLK